MIWTILIGIVIFVGLIVVGLVAWLMYYAISSKRKERRVREQGRPMLTSLMMANHSMYDPDGVAEAPGVVVFGFYQPNPKLPATLRSIGKRCHELYTAPNPDILPPVLRQFSLLLKDHMYDEDRRNRVPAEVAGTASVYVADLWIDRDRLPPGWREHRVLACAVTGTDQGAIVLLPPDDPAAQQIYAAAHVAHVTSPTDLPQLSATPPDARFLPAEARPFEIAEEPSRSVPAFVWFLVAGIAGAVLLSIAAAVLIHAMSSRRPDAEPGRATVAEVREAPPTPPRPTPPAAPPKSYSLRRDPSDGSTKPRDSGPLPGFVPPVRPGTGSDSSPFDEQPADNDAAKPTDNPPTPKPKVSPVQPSPTTWASDTLRIPFQSQEEITFGPIGCPVVIVGKEVWHFGQKKVVQRLQDEYNERGMKSLSGDGHWFAVASKSPNQKDTSIDVWNVVTGEPQCQIAGDPEKFADLIRFSRNQFLLVGGRHSEEIEVWDVESGKQLPTITTPTRRVDDEHITFTADGQYFTSVVNDSLTVIQTKNRKTAAVMESPRPVIDPQQQLNDVQRMIMARRVISSIEIVRFSPDGQELAAVSDSREPRLCCWNARGKLVFDDLIPRVQHVFFFDPTFDWLPDNSGWIVSGHIVDRETKRIVMAIRMPFADDPIFFPLDRDRLVGAFPHDPDVLQVIEIPWDRIHASLQLLEDSAPALLSPADPISIGLELKGLRGDAAATESVLTEALSKRLQADGLQVAAGRPTAFRLRFSEQAGDTLPIYERQSPFDFRGRNTGRTATEVEGSLVVELVAGGQVLWRDTIKATSSSSFREAINDTTIRTSMLENLARQMNRLSIPYFIPESKEHLALPVVIE